MAAYKMFFKKSVWKDFESIPNKYLSKIFELKKSPVDNPRQPSCTRLSGQEKYRLRCGQYRIIYSIQDDESPIWIVKVGHRKNVYR